MKRLVKLSELDMDELEKEYRRIIEDNEKDFYDKGHKNYELKEHTNNDTKTFLINPTNLVDYDNDQRDTSPRPGIPGPWASSLRWIGR